jgi:hypothetical protein
VRSNFANASQLPAASLAAHTAPRHGLAQGTGAGAYHASTLLDLADAAFKSGATVAEHSGRLWACSTFRLSRFDAATPPAATGVRSTLEGDAGELPRGPDLGADPNFESRGGQIW